MPSNILEKKINSREDLHAFFAKIKAEMTPEWIERACQQGRQNRIALMEETRRSCLSRWYPIVESIPGIKTPKTEILITSMDLEKLIFEDSKPRFWKYFTGYLEDLAEMVGYPAFLRTGVTSDKHSWDHSCHLISKKQIESHVFNLIDFSVMFDLPTDTWVLRELLDTKAMFHAFDGMPITTERRYFVKDGKVLCNHPYWPLEALDGHVSADVHESWRRMIQIDNSLYDHSIETGYLGLHSERVSDKIPGYWSIDWLLCDGGSKGSGWYLTDMGDGHRSWHWPDCPHDLNNLSEVK